MKQLKTYLFLLFCCSFWTCQEPDTNTRAFYFWKTAMKFKPSDQQLIKQLDVKQMYVRCFDVDWSFGYEDAIPISTLTYTDNKYDNEVEIIPTIFIVNRVFKHLPEKDFDLLAARILKKIPFRTGIKEIQIDCDWTASTRLPYFKFLQILKGRLQETQLLSVTVRLHQYRDRKLMGIPPVDRGMLMCYNVADPKKFNTSNSILDQKIVEQYIRGKRYPLSLDIALPIFHWGVWFRNNEFQGILSNWGKKDALNTKLYKAGDSNLYKVKKDQVIRNKYLREGDFVRLDGAFEADLDATIQLIKKRIRPRNCRITFFDWSTAKNAKYNEFNLQKYYKQLR